MPDPALAHFLLFLIACAGITAGSIYLAIAVTQPRRRKPKETL